MNIRKSAEDYLEMMLMLKEKHGYIRSVDIADELGVKKPSVSYATKRLRENGYITMDSDSYITLTETGMQIAMRMYERHRTLTDLLVALGVDGDVAREDACKIEHDLSEQSFDAICRHVGKSARLNHEKAEAAPIAYTAEILEKAGHRRYFASPGA
jgi:Mn-dependent DtxR family transcriptional regulator